MNEDRLFSLITIACTLSRRAYVQGGPKKARHKVLSISLSNINQLSKFFHWCILWKICHKVVPKHTTTP